MSGLEGAACRDADPLLFESRDLLAHKAAAEICAGCPAIEACRVYVQEVFELSRTSIHQGSQERGPASCTGVRAVGGH